MFKCTPLSLFSCAQTLRLFFGLCSILCCLRNRYILNPSSQFETVSSCTLYSWFITRNLAANVGPPFFFFFSCQWPLASAGIYYLLAVSERVQPSGNGITKCLCTAQPAYSGPCTLGSLLATAWVVSTGLLTRSQTLSPMWGHFFFLIKGPSRAYSLF